MVAHDLTPSVPLAERLDRENPFVGMRAALRNRNVILATRVNFLFICGEAGTVTFLTLQLTRVAHLPLAAAVTLSGVSGITGWLGQVVWDRLSDRAGRWPILAVLAVGWVIAMLGCIRISSIATAWVILLGWGLIIPPISGWLIATHGFTANYRMLAAIGGSALVPIAFLRDTVRSGTLRAEPAI